MKLLVVGLILLAMVFIAGCGPENLPGARPQIDAPSAVDATPISMETAAMGATTATPVPSIEPVITQTAAATAETDPGDAVSPIPTPTPTTVSGDSFPLTEAPTPIPTPDVNKVTVPELDSIAFVNPKPLPFPEELHGLLGPIHWSPDGSHYLGVLPEGVLDENGAFLASEEAIKSAPAIFVGNAQGTQFTIWKRNATSPTWSRDGESIYYLGLGGSDSGPTYDLYVQPLLSDADGSDLVVQQVAMLDTTRPSAAEVVNNQLLTYDSQGEVVLLRLGSGELPIPLEASLEVDKPYQIGASFQASPNGELAALIPFGQESVFIVDLQTLETKRIQTSGPVSVPTNLTWSSNSASIAYASPFGVYVYDLLTDQTRTVIGRRDLGLSEVGVSETPLDGFSSPLWSPHNDVLLFLAGTRSWEESGMRSGNRMFFLFGVTIEGGDWKVLSRYVINGMTQDGSKVVATGWPSDPEQLSGERPAHLFDIVWNREDSDVSQP